LSGDAEFIVEGNTYPLTPGSIVLMSPLEFHQLRLKSSAPYERFVIMFSHKLISSFDKNNTLLIPFHDRAVGRNNLYTHQQFSNILPIDLLYLAAEQVDDPAIAKIKVMSSLFMILSRILTTFRNSDESSRELLPSERITNYISQNLTKDLSRKELSNTFFLSESQINRIIKKATGLSVSQYVSTKRLYRAKEMLSQGIAPGDVFSLCGFQDYSTFFRAYKKLFGATPTEDRQKNDIP
jgi:AraC-like DNA-binding protein